MSDEKLKRYSPFYATPRDVEAATSGGTNNFLDGPRLMDTVINVRMGEGDASETYRMINQIISSNSGINANLKQLQAEMERVPARR